MSSWQYKVVRIDNWECETVLQNYGTDGWELVNIYPYYGWAYFKRTVFDLGDLE